MCTEFLLAVLYFITIFFVNYFLSKLLKNYIKNIFSLLKLKNIFYSFKKSANNLVFVLFSLFKKEKKIIILENLSVFSKTTDILIIGNTYKSIAKELKKENIIENKTYFFELLSKQYLSIK
jgi:hypothetical protein